MSRLQELEKKLDAEIQAKEEGIKAGEEERKKAEVARRNHNIESMVVSILLSGVAGLFLGGFIGFCKGCQRYGEIPIGSTVDGHDNLVVPFMYIPENALTVAIIGGVLGICIGLMRRQNKK